MKDMDKLVNPNGSMAETWITVCNDCQTFEQGVKKKCDNCGSKDVDIIDGN